MGQEFRETNSINIDAKIIALFDQTRTTFNEKKQTKKESQQQNSQEINDKKTKMETNVGKDSEIIVAKDSSEVVETNDINCRRVLKEEDCEDLTEDVLHEVGKKVKKEGSE